MAINTPSASSPTSTEWSTYDRLSRTCNPGRFHVNTGLEYIKRPEAFVTRTTDTPNLYSQPTAISNHSSFASISKSQLRQTNNTLIDMLQVMQSELEAHRSIMLNIQSRLSNLEHAPAPTSVPYLTASPFDILDEKYEEGRISSEGRKWWDVCKTFAHNCDTPFSASEFFRTPRHSLGFEFGFSPTKSRPPTLRTQSTSHDLSSPVSAIRSSVALPEDDGIFQPLYVGAAKSAPQVPRPPKQASMQEKSDIIEHVIFFDKLHVPAPPILASPPRSSRSYSTCSTTSTAISVEKDLTALPAIAIPKRSIGKVWHNKSDSASSFSSLKNFVKGKCPVANGKSECSPGCEATAN